MFQNAAIIGVGQSAYTRRPEPGQTALHFMRDAVVAALDDAGLKASDIEGREALWQYIRLAQKFGDILRGAIQGAEILREELAAKAQE